MPEILHQDGQMIVEARTAQEALSVVTDELGTRARIVAVDKVVRGGLKGFFARELVKVVAEPQPGEDGWDGEGLVRTLSDELVTASLSETRVGPMPEPEADEPEDEVAELMTAPEGLRIDRGAVTPVPAPRRGGSPATAALERLMAQRLDQQTFGEALRRELDRNGWRPVDDDPTDPNLRRALTALADVADVADVGQVPAAVAVEERPQPALDEDRARTAQLWITHLQSDEDRVIRLDDDVRDEIVATPEMLAALGLAQPDTDEVAATEPGTDEVVPCEPVVDEPVPAEPGTDWAAALAAVGLPAELCATVEAAAPADGDALVEVLAEALAPLCRELPHGDAALVGPAAAELAEETGIPMIGMDSEFHATGDVAIPVPGTRQGRRELAWLRDGRWLNVVVGEGNWGSLVREDAAVVTALRPEDLPAAVTAARDHDLVLGPAIAAPGRRQPANPVSVARTLRTLAVRGR